MGFGGDGVGGGPLVGVVSPGLAFDSVVDPGVGVAGGGFVDGLVAHVLGEGLVEPDVVPPGEGDEVAEPHVGHLVGDNHGASLAFADGDGGAEDEFVAEGDEAGVLHGAGVEFGDERLVVGVEGVGLFELLVVAVEALPGDVEDLVGVGVEVGGEGAAAVDAEGEAGVAGADGVPGAGGDGDEVGGDAGGGGGGPAAVAGVGGGAVGEDGPVPGGGDGDVVGRLEVGLVEGGEDALDVVEEELGVDVGLAVCGVGEAVHALAGAGVAHGGVDVEFVGAFGEAGEGEAVVVEGGGVEGLPVEGDAVEGGRLEFDEGVAGGPGGEPDAGDGVEGVVAGGQVEVDGVVVDVQGAGSGLRLFARQCGHGPMLPDAVGAGQRVAPAASGGGCGG